MRILLVDDHAVVRGALAAMLRLDPDVEIVGEASTGRTAIEQAEKLEPDVVLMDINMPEMNGIEATRVIRSRCPDVRVIGLSMYSAADQMEPMLRAGASGYVSKSDPPHCLLDAIRLQLDQPT